MVKEYISTKVRVKAYFKRGKISPSITLDIWTSPNGLSILAITAHWVDDDYVLREIVLDSVEIIGNHSGKNIAKSVLKCLKEFEIDSKVFTITADNAANNRTMAKELAKNLKQFDHSIHLLGCMGHVINLAAKRGLYCLAAIKEYETEEVPEEEDDEIDSNLVGIDDDQDSEEESFPEGYTNVLGFFVF